MDNDCYSRGDGILSTGMCKNQNLKRRQDAELIADGAPDAPRPYSQGMGIPGTSTSMNPEPKTYPEPKQNCEIEEIDKVYTKTRPFTLMDSPNSQEDSTMSTSTSNSELGLQKEFEESWERIIVGNEWDNSETNVIEVVGQLVKNK